MKSTEYKVIYLNGNEEIFYCMGVDACFSAATHFANSKSWDARIKYIHDEHGNTYSDFKLTYKTN